jgi:hypothetical protein
MRSLPRYCLPLALLLVASLAEADGPKTALGSWMKNNMGSVMAAGPDSQGFQTLAANFAIVAKGAPDPKAYPGWAGFANQGVTAANANDPKAVKAACNACHNAPSTTGAKNMKEQYQKDSAAPKTFP